MQPSIPWCVGLLIAALCLGPGCASGKARPEKGSARKDRLRESEAELDHQVRAQAAFATGIIAQLEENSEGALDWFKRSLEHDPEHEALALDVARRLIQRKDYDQAVRVLERIATRPNASGTVFSLLAVTQTELGRPEEAIASLREAVRRAPTNVNARRLLAQLLAEQKKSDESLAVLDDAAAQDSTDPTYWAELAELFYQQGGKLPGRIEETNERAVKALRRAVELKPEDPVLLQRMAERFADLNQNDDAERLFKQLRARFPNNPLPAARLADIYLRTGRNQEAQEQLEIIKRENPTNPLPWYYLGMIAFEEKKFERAAEMFKQATQMNPEFEPAYLDWASAQLSLNQPEQALATLETARSKFKSNFRLEFLAGIAATRLQRLDDAVRHFTDAELRAKATQPGALDHRFYFQLGATFERKGELQKATQNLEKALELKPDFADALNHLGYMWADKGENLERAHGMIRKAVEQEPENEAFLDSLAWVLFKLGKPDEALPWMEKALKFTEKPDATLYDHLGDILAALKRWNDAKEAWQKSLAVEKSELVQKKLNQAGQ